MQKKAFTQSGKRQLQVFSQMMQMKFKPRSNAATTALVSKNKQLIEKSSKNNDQLDLSRSTLSRMVNRDKKLKYLSSLSPEYFLIGNQNQVDMINIVGIAYSFVDTDYCWSLSIPSGIDCLAVEPRKCLIAIVSERKLYFFRYNLKKSKQEPEMIKDFDIKSQPKFIQFPKDSMLALFYQKQFEIYNVQQHKKIYKKCSKTYNEPNNFILYAVPQVVENSLKVFFTEQHSDSKTFGLWYIKINIQFTSIDIEKPQKVYDIKRNLKKMLVIQNFSKDIIFMNIGAQILAAKNGYILDSANVNIQSGNAKLKYISNQRLIHISDSKLEIYKMNILTNIVPNKIQVIPVDALQIRDKPHQAQFFGIIGTLGDNFAVFYQNISQFNVFTKGQATYWFVTTEAMPLDQKIRRIFDYGSQISKLNPQLLQEKCDMARKMGLSQKQLYLEIWNRSNKNSIQDYQFILATRNYKTIHSQIQKKLKKQSMSFRQLLKIQQSCLAILRQSVYGPKCTQQNIQQFLTSHSFIKKLKLFKDIELYRKKIKKSIIRVGKQEQEQSNKLLINIQQYYQYKDFDIKVHILQKIQDFCYGKDFRDVQIRMMLRSFKFVYRIIYKQFLEEMIKKCKGKLVILLKQIPEILPYPAKAQSELQANQEVSLYEGIWNQIKPYEWQRNLFIQNITTIDNKQVVQQFVKSIWYRRFWLTGHELINLTRQNILQINESNNSELIFYYFISKVFQLIPDEQTQFQIIYFLQMNYSNIPDHLKGKIFLHYKLHKFYIQYHQKAKLKPLRLDQFLNLNDAQLFQYFFTQQKHTKNCILRNIKKIYQQTCEQGEGLILFNEGLLAYFKSDLSQISDLKYLLNRMNNQKTQFHEANLSIYEVLVRAMQYKLKLGSLQDIPIDQVLIYIENIPISKNNQIMEQLQIVQKINEEANRFKKMRINMTIKEIIDNFEDVISKIVQYEFEANRIKYIRNERELLEVTYKILAQVQAVKQKIYGVQRNNYLPFFIYETKLLQQIHLIQFAKQLLHNEFINKHYPIDIILTQNLVLYMYKWVFSQNSTFLHNAQYIKQLVTLLPQDNQNRRFIQNQTLFAIALSTQKQPLQYPISTQNQYPTIFELQQILKFLPIEHVLQVDIQAIYNYIRIMQDITLSQVQKQQNQLGVSTIQKITQYQIYSAFVIKVIQQNRLNDVIPLIKKMIQFDIPNKRYNVTFFALLIQKLSTQLNDQSKNVMIKMLSYSFDNPEILFQFIEYYFNSKQTPLQKGKHLKQMMDNYIKNKINFNQANFLFNSQFKNALNKQDVSQNSKKVIQNSGKHLKATKPQFQSIQYDILFLILCNQPYIAAKYIQANQFSISFKTLRNYLSFVVSQPLFDQRQVIDFCKKIFGMILQSNIKRKDISRIIFNHEKFYFSYNQVRNMGIQDQIDKRIQKTYKNFQKKKKSLMHILPKRLSVLDSQSQQHQIIGQLKNPDDLSSQAPSQYIFSDSDNEPAEQQIKNASKPSIKKRKKQAPQDFNVKNQRNKFMKRKNSFFGDKSVTLSRSRNSQRQIQQVAASPNNVTKSLSLQVPDVKKPVKIYVKRTYTNESQTNIAKKNFSAITQKQQSSENPSKLSKQYKLQKIDKRESILYNQSIQDSKISRQQSQYSMNEISQDQSEDLSYRIKALIIQNYDSVSNKIDFQPLSKQQSQQEFKNHLKDVLHKIYNDKQIESKNKLKIIRLVCQKYTKVNINLVFLTIYQNIQKTSDSYFLDIPIDRLLPFDGLFIQSKLLDDLFKLILPQVIQISTDQNILKLSKSISFGFKKNIYQSEISFHYIQKMIGQFSQGHSDVQLNMRLQTIRTLLGKMSILALKQKAPKLIQGIFANPDLIQKIIATVVQSVKKRGDANSAAQIKKLMQK